MDDNKLIEKISCYDSKYSEMLKEIWNDKRFKALGIKAQQYVLCAYFSEPLYDIGLLFEQLLSFLSSTDPIVSSTWSREWGKTRIALSPQTNSGFTFIKNSPSNKSIYQPIFTSKYSYPSLMMYSSRKSYDDYDIHIILNDSYKISLEGVYIQLIRMVDELVWTTALDIHHKSHDQMRLETAYQLALKLISKQKVSVSFAPETVILDKRKENISDIIRLYGDIHEANTIPWVIGLITKSKMESGLHYIHKKHIQDSATIFLASYTIGKRPHIGHLFLLSRIKTLAHFSKEEIEVVIEMNDTGERFDNLLEVAINDTQINKDMLIRDIIEGRYTIMDLERWYVKRKKEEKKYRTIRNQQIQMPLRQQANSVFDTLAPVFGQFRHGFLLSSELDTEVLLKYSNIKWQNTGFENINNFVLKRNGKPTAFLTRMAFLNEIIKTRTGEIIYVDSTNAIKNAIGVIEGITGRTIYSVPGAAVGFDFVIHSGSHSKDDVTLTSIYKWYLNSVSCQLSELIDDINYLTIFLPMHISEHKKDEGFYNFRTVNDLKAAIIEVHKKRIETLDKIKQARLLITIGTKSIIKPNTPSFIKQKSKYALQKFIKRAYRTFTKGDLSVKSYYNYLEEQPENINAANRECPKGVTTSQNKLYYYLLKCLQCNINIHSTTLDILRLEGYCSNEELISALNNLLNFDIEMKLQLSYSQMILHHIMLIMDNYLSLSKEDSELYFSIIDYYLQSLK